MKTKPCLVLAGVLLSASLAACGSTPPAVVPPVAVTPGSGTVAGFSGSLDGTLSALTATTFSLGGQTVSLGLGSQSLRAQSLTSQGSAAVRVNGESSSPDVLAAGQTAHVEVKDGVASSVDVRIEVRGKIESVDVTGGKLSVSGQTIAVTGSTRISLGGAEAKQDAPVHTLAELAALKDALVEVSGTRDASGTIQARRIEVRTPEQRAALHLDSAEIAGKISAVDPAVKTFVVNGVTVNYAAVTVKGTLSVGAGVEARGTYDEATKVLTAVRVNVYASGEAHDSPAPQAGAKVVIEGELTKVDAAARTVSLGGYTIDLSQASVDGTPTVGARVHLEGSLDKTDAKLVHAVSVRVQKAEDVRFEGTVSKLSGKLFDLDMREESREKETGASVVTVHVDASQAEIVGEPKVGVPAVVFGHYANSERTTLIAGRVLGPQAHVLQGTVRDLNVANKVFRMGDVYVTYGSAKVTGTLVNAAKVTVNGMPGAVLNGARSIVASEVNVQAK